VEAQALGPISFAKQIGIHSNVASVGSLKRAPPTIARPSSERCKIFANKLLLGLKLCCFLALLNQQYVVHIAIIKVKT